MYVVLVGICNKDEKWNWFLYILEENKNGKLTVKKTIDLNLRTDNAEFLRSVVQMHSGRIIAGLEKQKEF